MGSFTPPKKRPAAAAKRKPDFRHLALVIALPALALCGYFGYRAVSAEEAFVFTTAPAAREAAPAVAVPPAPVVPPQTDAKDEPKPAIKPESKRGAAALPRASGGKRIVILIDDIGFENQPLAKVAAIDPNFTFSVIPNAPRARASAEFLAARGFEILCHLPMEPLDPAMSPGRDAILVSMPDDLIRVRTLEHFRAVPHARGLNNHMGSRATADRRVMEQVLTVLRQEDAFFVDSRTSPRSVGFELARAIDVRSAARDVFLDDDPRETAVLRQLTRLAEAAERHGTALGIGHAYPSTVRVLEREIPRLRELGFRIVRVSEVVE